MNEFLTFAVMSDLLIVAYVQFLIRLRELKEVLIVYITLTLNPLTWRIWWAPNNASRWQMGFNSAFKGLNANSLQQGVFLCGATQPQSYWKEQYQRVWLW